MGHLIINEDYLDVIIGHLSIKDMLQCSMVNIAWREAFNKNRYWKYQCLKYNLNDTIQYLRETPCQVEPRFVVPVTLSHQLEPLCDWRVNYMRVLHLINNWIQGQYVVRNMKGRFAATKLVIFKNWLCACDYSAGFCTMYDIVDRPSFQIKFALALEYATVQFLAINNDRLVIIQHNLLQVYTVRGCSVELAFRRLVDKPELCNIPDDVRLQYWYSENRETYRGIKCNPKILYSQVDDVLISLKEIIFEDRLYTFYIWNLKSGSIINQVQINILPDFTVVNMHTVKLKESEIFIGLTTMDLIDFRYDTTVYDYNVLSNTVKKQAELFHCDLKEISKYGTTLQYYCFQKHIEIRYIMTGQILSLIDIRTPIQFCAFPSPCAFVVDLTNELYLIYNTKPLCLAIHRERILDLHNPEDPFREISDWRACSLGNISNMCSRFMSLQEFCISENMSKMAIINNDTLHVYHYW